MLSIHMLCCKVKIYPILFLLLIVSSAYAYVPAANRMEAYLPLLKFKKVGLVVNPTSVVGNTHLVDTLLKLNIKIVSIFAPEHGFRGNAEAGQKIADSIDLKTGIPILSVYGKKTKPDSTALKQCDVIVFYLQDVGVRFYTYISTLHYVMEACAEANVPLIVIDCPNPNRHYVDGPVLKTDFNSFVGMHPVPVVYGLTIGEYANMINGEKWLKNGIQCNLKVIKLGRYDSNIITELPIPPSPNLPNALSVLLYPSLCWFEGAQVSLGRGTNFPFQCYGAPWFPKANAFDFTPIAIIGKSLTPPFKGEKCYGFDLSSLSIDSLFQTKSINLSYLVNAYQTFIANENNNGQAFFNAFFNKLAGNDQLQSQIKMNISIADIKKSWQSDISKYLIIRKKYLLYKSSL